MHGRISWVVVASILLAPPSSALAWGFKGHRVVGRVAQEHLTPAAAKAVRELLDEGESLATVSTWADEIRRDRPETGPWHYVNAPVTAAGYSDRDCARQGECVVSKVKDFREILADTSAPRDRRQEALKFLVHFLQDMHQPLHVGDNGDKGGNATQVQFFGQGSNLHRVWDSGIIDRAGGSDADWARQVSALLTPEAIRAWTVGGVDDWAQESHRAAKLAYYFPKGARQPMRSGTRLGQEYQDFALPIVRERLAQAAIRLAHELNTILDPGR